MAIKNIIKKFILSVIILLFIAYADSGCKKQALNDALPVLKMASVTMAGTDSVMITGTIVSPGGDPIQYEGFCYGVDPVPDIQENQQLSESGKTTFSITLAVKQDSTYFFRCFASNTFGYALSSPMKFTVAHAKPLVVPCSLTDMKVEVGNIPYNVDLVYSGTPYATYGNWGLEADYGNATGAIIMDFNKVPTNGAYVTVADPVQFQDNGNPKEVFVENNSFNMISMISGDTVYVSENPDKSQSFSFCGLHFYAGSTKFSAIGKFTAK